jgi:CDP-diacylglycerol--glycerol-3-phosphate 3-phosphatidyltransferase
MPDADEKKARRHSIRQDALNIPNLLTMARIVMIPICLALIGEDTPRAGFWAAIVFTLAAITDLLDGWLARKMNVVSVLGKLLDPLADKLIVTAVLVFMVALSRVPAWIVVVLIARDLAITGLRSIASAQGLVIAASDGGKIKTALQLVAIMMLLIYFRYPVLGTNIVIDYQRDGYWVLIISMGVSLFSGAQYMRHFFAAALRQPRTS